jgi:hypothetical protein
VPEIVVEMLQCIEINDIGLGFHEMCTIFTS